MRITGGRARGIPLNAGKSQSVRPATDRMREAVFSSIAHQVSERRVLDLFAGSGAYGLEAWSRGASSVVFCESHPATVRCLQGNVEAVARSLGKPVSDAIVHRLDLYKGVPEGRYDLIFADPPYPDLPRAIPRVHELAARLLHEEGLLCLETPGHKIPKLAGFELLKSLGKGKDQPTVSLYRMAPTN